MDAAADHWASALSHLGDELRSMPPTDGQPSSKRGKSDAADAEMLFEAATRPTQAWRADHAG
jgi:transposase